MGQIRLQKFLANAGVASRRQAEIMIISGKIEVNGKVEKELGTKVNKWDEIKVEGEIVCLKDKDIYIMLNKPKGFITTVKDQFSRKTVMDLLTGIDDRIYPVGRLDYDTSGLLILTNDGDLTYKLTHPKHEVEKTYIAEVKGKIKNHDITRFAKGIIIDDFLTMPAVLEVIKEEKFSTEIKIVLKEGRNRQVRKMCKAIGNPVISLKRVSIGPLHIGNLQEGLWRNLTYSEIQSLNDLS